MASMNAYRHKDTGIIMNMPDHLAELFDRLELVEPEDFICTDCQMQVPEDEVEDEETDEEDGDGN